MYIIFIAFITSTTRSYTDITRAKIKLNFCRQSGNSERLELNYKKGFEFIQNKTNANIGKIKTPYECLIISNQFFLEYSGKYVLHGVALFFSSLSYKLKTHELLNESTHELLLSSPWKGVHYKLYIRKRYRFFSTYH